MVGAGFQCGSIAQTGEGRGGPPACSMPEKPPVTHHPAWRLSRPLSTLLDFATPSPTFLVEVPMSVMTSPSTVLYPARKGRATSS